MVVVVLVETFCDPSGRNDTLVKQAQDIWLGKIYHGKTYHDNTLGRSFHRPEYHIMEVPITGFECLQLELQSMVSNVGPGE
ncbi:hypothetical protein BELL_0389g00110 [Botrytis elliptica]|uniref:Uncharacterized protein n=1 Tax=Botrytis elliptica TaxID=278938 RepID=A0A4Z1JHD3_9HELO|nr:hypothetical protein BELL_0389g00110 [Botrytis elliptica]